LQLRSKGAWLSGTIFLRTLTGGTKTSLTGSSWEGIIIKGTDEANIEVEKQSTIFNIFTPEMTV
jgi:hypothetical protein